MYNLHTHTLLSDGDLLPSEVAVRFLSLGYRVIAITDHADHSNIKTVISGVLSFTRHWPKDSKIKVLPGIELTHLPLNQFKPLAKHAREKGIRIIVGHGETIVEPVIKGTNRAALQSDIDILAHPGLISAEDVKLAKERGIFLEITSRKGHRHTNGHVIELARRIQAKLILNIDSHSPEDIVRPGELVKAGLHCGLTREEIEKIYRDTERLISKRSAR